ncbi:2-oxoisovalerate dehydrogenase subunit alpha [Peribacillus frigoritolerans]|nr:2-oxoisovalerate dehydrogenase subunit alpha [Peribacillus frigoritolerans]
MTFGAYLKEVGIMDDDLEKQMNDEVMKIVNEATDYAESAPYPKAESAMNHVYAQK